MKVNMFEVFKSIKAQLDSANIYYDTRAYRDDAFSFLVHVPGEYWEIDVREDGSVDLDGVQRLVYLVTIVGSVATTGMIVAPVAFHRLLFHQQQRPWLVEAAHSMAKAGLLMLAVTTSGVIMLVFDVVVSRGTAYLAATVTLTVLMGMWAGIPLLAHGRPRSD